LTAEVKDPEGRVESILDEAREALEAQLEELRPAHEAFVRLERIVSNYDAVTSDQPITGRSGDRASRGSRPQQFLAIVAEAGDEGVTVSEALPKMEGINNNYLYRIAADAVKEGIVRKEGKRYFTA
jgi:hypothetical protein